MAAISSDSYPQLSMSPPSYSVFEDSDGELINPSLQVIWPERPLEGKYSAKEHAFKAECRRKMDEQRKRRSKAKRSVSAYSMLGGHTQDTSMQAVPSSLLRSSSLRDMSNAEPTESIARVNSELLFGSSDFQKLDDAYGYTSSVSSDCCLAPDVRAIHSDFSSRASQLTDFYNKCDTSDSLLKTSEVFGVARPVSYCSISNETSVELPATNDSETEKHAGGDKFHDGIDVNMYVRLGAETRQFPLHCFPTNEGPMWGIKNAKRESSVLFRNMAALTDFYSKFPEAVDF